ncbi:MAG: type IV secretion system DNA-binding domain-containing protein, partial [Candidatus Kerfeldbacteria bacterium]|nr:type IV secretion system DNA-binding domain-containing protein [Candidatus Kerfeldbacteria bacterium]
MPDDVTYFARTNYRNQFRKFGIKLDDRRRHMYLIGKTGMGKSTTLENMIVQDIQSGQGLAVIDPHGDLIEKVLDYVPTSRINDVVYFNPSDITYPMAFNVLETVTPEQRYLVASGLMSVFKKIWADSWGPRLEYVLRNTILSLLEYPGTTLLGINRLLVDKLFRRKVVSKITDPIIKAFWIDEYAAYSANFRTEAISPIQNKVGQFLSSSVIRNIVGQPKSTIDLRDVMDNHKILLMNLAKGRIGEDNSALLGAMMITKIQLAAMSRVNVPESERSDFLLYVDEFQNFATESFAAILSEARKYRLDLIIAHQYIEQLEEEVRAAVFGNVGTIVCFRVGAADAEFLEREFAPIFDENDLVNLTKYDVYLKLMIDGVASTAFSATTIEPLTESGKTGTREKVIQVSRERYAKPREVVEEKISRWSGFHEEEPSAPASERPSTRSAGNAEPVRERPRERPA